MTKRTASEIRKYAKMARKIAKHHFGKDPNKVEYKPAGRTNYVFEVRMGTRSYIIRLSDDPEKLNHFIKEQWACEKAGELGVPVPEILDMDDEVIPLPYMLLAKVKGIEAIHHPHRSNILKELGRYARIIHSIRTTGFGENFDAKWKTWKEYLHNELAVNDRLEFLRKNNFLSPNKIDHLDVLFEKISEWKPVPSLNHCDLRLKNLIVDKEGKINAIIDWENCSSHIAPYWDFSIALHDLSIDNKQKFLEGYNLDLETFGRMSFSITAFNLINYVPALQSLMERDEKTLLEYYKLRMNGDFDLFSL